VLAAQKLILEQVQRAYGGAADAAGKELGGQMTILKHDVEDVGAAFLRDLQPQIKSAVTDLQHWLDTTVNTAGGQRKLKQDAHELADGIKELAGDIKTVAGDANAVAKAFGGWKTVLETIVEIKLAAWAVGVSKSLTTLIGTEAAAGSGALIGGEVSGLAGAGAASGLLLSNLQALAAIGTIVVTMKLIKDWVNAGNQKDVSSAAADASGGRVDLGKLRQDIGGKLFGGGAAGEIYFDPSTGKFDAAGAIGTMNGAESFDKTLTTAQAAKLLGMSAKKLLQIAHGVDVPANTPGPRGFTKSQVMGAAASYANTPYQWGGGHGAVAGPSFASGHGRAGLGLDCSGYARAVLSNLGITVNGDANSLLASAKSHPSVVQLQPGDLVFYEGIHPNHVMVYIGNGQVIGETHTGASGPEVKPVNYLKITGTGRYTASEQNTGSTSSTKPPPPPPTATKLTDIPNTLRYALSLAEGTTGKGDDKTAIGNIVAFLRAQLGKTSNLGKKADILDEINSYTSSLDGLSGKAKSKYASGSSVASFGDALKSELAGLATIASAGFDGVAAKARPKLLQLQKLIANPVTPKDLAMAKVQLKELEKAYDLKGLAGVAGDVKAGKATGNSLLGALASLPADLKIPLENAWGEVVNTISPSDLTAQVKTALQALGAAKTSGAAKAALAQLKTLGQEATAAVSIDKDGVVKAAQDAIDAANQVVSDRSSSFESAWSRMSQKALSAFDQETQDALASMKVLVNFGGSSFTYGDGDLTPSQQLAKQLQDQTDAASKAKAYKTAQDDVASKQARVNQLVGAGFSENTNALRSARQDLSDAQDTFNQLDLQRKVDALTAQGDVEQTAAQTQLAQAKKNYQSERDLQREHIQDMLDDLEKGLESGRTSIADAKTKLGKLWDAIGLDAGGAGAAMGDAFVSSLNETLNDPANGLWTTLDQLSKAIADLKNLKDLPPPTVTGGAGGGGGGVPGGGVGGKREFAFASGAYVRARPGGVRAVVGEGGDDEVVSPVPMLRKVVREELGRTQPAGATLHIENYHAYDGTDEQLLVGKLSLLMQSRPRP
jgi:cell wall-associated NlpC family hydrolase